MFSETPLLQPIRPARHFHVIDEEQINQLANGTLEILAETGVHCPSEKCLRIYAEHGAQVDFDKQIVRIAPHLVAAFPFDSATLLHDGCAFPCPRHQSRWLRFVLRH